ncbi:MAG: DUF4055 domain-containing protein [Pseudomonadota bacterium]
METRLKHKEAQMAATGARMLAPEKSGVEAAETVEMRHSGESSVLASVVKTAQEGINKALEILGNWGGTEPAEITLNTDFMAKSMTPQEITSLIAAWQSGALSKQELYRNLQRGEIIDADKEYDDHEEEIFEDVTLPDDAA